MPRDTGIAARLRAAGVVVVEVAGWQTRGSETFAPKGAVNHHTAGPSRGATPSLNTCIYGRSDLPGPLCHVLQSREASGPDKAYVIAAGRANHAGSGGWKGITGNASVFGLEIEHDGVSPLPMARQQIAARIIAALWKGNPAMVCQHREWTTRKIDAATNVDPAGFRAMVAAAGKPAPAPPKPKPEPEEDDMPKQFLCRLGAKRPEVLLVSAARDSVHWVRSKTALTGYQTQITLDGGNKDVCILDPADADANLAALASMVLNLPMVGAMPPAYVSLWKGPHVPGSAPGTAPTKAA